MALALHPGDISDPTNPVISYVYVEQRVGTLPLDDAGFIDDVELLTYRVVRPDGTDLVPVTAVNLLDAPAGARVRLGTYAPTIDLTAEPTGFYTVEWVAQRLLSDPFTLSQQTRFQVVPVAEPIPNGYALVSNMRKEGVPAGFCNEDIVRSIEVASRYIERVTRRFFEPRYLTFQRDGRGEGLSHMLDDPIIGIEDMDLTFTDFRPLTRLIDRTDVRVYNRHMRGLIHPDDRDSPKIEILRVNAAPLNTPIHPPLVRRFTQAQQNVQLTGWFGYTDPDGSPLGITPVAIRRITMQIAMRELRPLWEDFGGGRKGGTTGPLKSEKTRDQTVVYGSGKDAGAAGAGWITGDSAIDQILSSFVGPMPMAAV